MSLIFTLLAWLIIITWPCVLLLIYTMFSTKLRFVLQNFFIIPITIIVSLMVGMIGLVVKYLTFSLISNELRIFLLAWISQQFMQFMLFLFEFWPNNRFVVSDEDVSDDIFYINTIILSNHSQSPFDWMSVTSFADYLDRLQYSFIFMKKQFAYIPIIGWLPALHTAKPLQRDWAKDKKYIKSLCDKFKSNTDYRLVTPWCWFSYPEGTRISKKKLKEAKAFARKRGYPEYNHLLQPRVKGFSYLTHHLYDVLGCIIDTTYVYHPKNPTAKKFFLNTRLVKYTHVHVRVYRQDQIPHINNDDLSEYDQWLRDRWTEKDKIMEKMKNREIKFRILHRSPWRVIRYYTLWTTFMMYLLFQLVYNIGFIWFCLLLVTALFPAVIVAIERSQTPTGILHEINYQK